MRPGMDKKEVAATLEEMARLLELAGENPFKVRAFAAGAHYCEEIEREEPVRLGQSLTPKEWYDGPEDRPVPSREERKNVAKEMVAQTPEEWKRTFLERQKIPGSGWAIVEEIDDPRRKI